MISDDDSANQKKADFSHDLLNKYYEAHGLDLIHGSAEKNRMYQMDGLSQEGISNSWGSGKEKNGCCCHCCVRDYYELSNNIEIVKCCQYYFDFNLPSDMLAKRTDKFEEKFKNNCTFGKYLT